MNIAVIPVYPRFLAFIVICIFYLSSENFPPEIVNASSVIQVTLNSTVTVNFTVRDPNNDTLTLDIVNKPDNASIARYGDIFTFTWSVVSSQKVVRDRRSWTM